MIPQGRGVARPRQPTRVLALTSARSRLARVITRRHLLAGAATGTVLLVAGCTGDAPTTPPGPLPPDSTETPRVDPNTHRVVTRTPSADTVIPAGPDGAIAASRALLAAATAVVVVAAAPASAAPTAVATPSPATATLLPGPTFQVRKGL